MKCVELLLKSPDNFYTNVLLKAASWHSYRWLKWNNGRAFLNSAVLTQLDCRSASMLFIFVQGFFHNPLELIKLHLCPYFLSLVVMPKLGINKCCHCTIDDILHVHFISVFIEICIILFLCYGVSGQWGRVLYFLVSCMVIRLKPYGCTSHKYHMSVTIKLIFPFFVWTHWFGLDFLWNLFIFMGK